MMNNDLARKYIFILYKQNHTKKRTKLSDSLIFYNSVSSLTVMFIDYNSGLFKIFMGEEGKDFKTMEIRMTRKIS